MKHDIRYDTKTKTARCAHCGTEWTGLSAIDPAARAHLADEPCNERGAGALLERNRVLAYLFSVAQHWRDENRRLIRNNPEAAGHAAAKCAVLEGVAADIQDAAHMRQR